MPPVESIPEIELTPPYLGIWDQLKNGRHDSSDTEVGVLISHCPTPLEGGDSCLSWSVIVTSILLNTSRLRAFLCFPPSKVCLCQASARTVYSYALSFVHENRMKSFLSLQKFQKEDTQVWEINCTQKKEQLLSRKILSGARNRLIPVSVKWGGLRRIKAHRVHQWRFEADQGS
ncbi:hypothetical protein AVEN_60515-1 [Araneus ventricosus]|uniref:Uncharacterized protein n=1 Tax=Araneus ventricosus TaxID=182803 RepID=A0A4Y2FQC5_ARAVE|nr:hypothetical protein AVEN_60515-1 [Araneus ventricosus]